MLAPVEGTQLEQPLSPCERLWRVVIGQALVDAFFERVGTSTSVTSEREQKEARLFLF